MLLSSLLKSESERERHQEREGFANAGNRPGLETLLGRETLAWSEVKVAFTLGSKTKETPKSSDLIGREKKTWTNEFTFHSKFQDMRKIWHAMTW